MTANTFTGTTTITGGTLQLGNGSTAGSVTGAIVDNGTLAINLPGTIVFSNPISTATASSTSSGSTRPI